MFPIRRNRRLRANEAIRGLVRETIITPNEIATATCHNGIVGGKIKIAWSFAFYTLKTIEKRSLLCTCFQ